MIHEGILAPETARARLLQTVEKVVGTESCALEAAAGRRLYKALVATANLPATANAAVDGYAVHADFLAAHPAHAFTVVGRAAAGHPFSTGLGKACLEQRSTQGGVVPFDGCGSLFRGCRTR